MFMSGTPGEKRQEKCIGWIHIIEYLKEGHKYFCFYDVKNAVK